MGLMQSRDSRAVVKHTMKDMKTDLVLLKNSKEE